MKTMQPRTSAVAQQRGVSTLAVTLILLVIITAMVLFSTSVGYFEQRTTTNQNRARIAEQSAEYALSLAGEYLKANRDRLISDEATDEGWFAPGFARWAKCADVASPPAGHPCLSERDLARRAQLYFWTADGTVNGSRELPYTAVIPATAQVEDGVGGTADFDADTAVGALLCRLDTTDPANVHCALEPASGNRIALTLVGQASLPGEGSDAIVKEAWATYNSFVPSAAVPLVASGWVQGLGNAQIVAAPNAGGYGLPASIWTANDADITTNGSFVTCHYGDYLKGTPEAGLKTTCATTDDCSCGGGGSSQFLSGHMGGIAGTGGVTREAEDIIDRDSGVGVLPDINFFPGGGMDKPGDMTDDSLFEYTFNVNYTTAPTPDPAHAGSDPAATTLQNCGELKNQNCVTYAMMEEFQADEITQAECLTLDANSSGIIYASAGCTALPSGTGGTTAVIGSPESPVILVLNQTDAGQLSIGKAGGNLVVYGLLFVHDDTPETAKGAVELVTGQGGVKIFGALVVEGNVKMSGELSIVYDDTSTSGDTHKLPSSAKFGRVAGSWLDSGTAF